MNNKGFTILEIIVIVLSVALLIIIGIAFTFSIMHKYAGNSFSVQKGFLEAGAITYTKKYSDSIKTNLGDCSLNGDLCSYNCHYTVKELVELGAYNDTNKTNNCLVANADDNSECLDDYYVEVTMNNNGYYSAELKKSSNLISCLQ